MTDPVCTHLDQVQGVTPASNGCVDCLAIGGRWVHLRLCMTCGHVGCCDSSPNRHATAHFHTADHPLVTSYEPGEDWWWCYRDDVAFEVADARTYSHS
jgi:uncharacterized UBP type Zn finger protein